MHLGESITIGVKEIAAHKMRSILTMLGVIFGVAAVISTVAIGAGAQEETMREISLLGTNNIRIRKLKLEGLDKAKAQKKAPHGLTRKEVQAIKVLCGDGIVSDGVARRVETSVTFAGEAPPVALLGVSPGYAESIDFLVEHGRYITRFDIEGEKKVCVIGDEVLQILFPLDPNNGLGQKLQIGGRDYIIVGVMKRKSASSAGGVLDVGNLNQYVMIPLSTAMVYYEDDRRAEQLDEIVIKIEEGRDLQELAYVAGRQLQRLHGGVKDFEIIIPAELIRQKQRVQEIFGYTLIAIAGISLLVGGIGIMNIMLSTVTQRTREIGVRRAIGATRHDILSQFIIEAIVLSVVGGLLGIGLGFGLAKLISAYAEWNTPISPVAIAVSFSVACGTGLCFGIYPAMKAAQLDPIEALRYE